MSGLDSKNELKASRFKRVRRDHGSETASDYCELIDELIRTKGEARIVDLALSLGVSQATVTKTVQRLKRDGLVTAEPYRSVFLTEVGETLAAQSREKHDLMVSLLLKLGVRREIAEIDAEGMEHHASGDTLEAIRRYLAGS